MQIWICEDEESQQRLLAGYIREYQERFEKRASVRTFSNAGQVLFALAEERPDLLILDIQMEGMSGMELAERMRSREEKTAILFVTAVPDYIYEGFNVGAVNYLLKPVEKEKLFQCLQKAEEDLGKTEIWLLRADQEIYRVRKNRIYYVESQDHYLQIHGEEGILRVKMSMKEAEAALRESRFYRMGRSYLLNLEAVDRLKRDTARMADGAELSVPRSKRKELAERFLRYHFGEQG